MQRTGQLNTNSGEEGRVRPTAVITGAGGGIGAALAQAYHQAGYRLMLVDRDEVGLQQVKAAIEHGSETGSTKHTVTMTADLRDPDTARQVIAAAVGLFGGVDVLINNAGFGIWKSPLELEWQEWDDVINTNLRGTFLYSREAAKVMRERGFGGAIVNIASTRAAMSEPNSEAYAASKGGIVALTHAMAVSLGPERIRVNCISPGWIETGDYDALRDIDHQQHLIGRVGRPEDIVRACFYLTDPDNDFVTGINLTVDGGMTRKMIYEP
ncbi:SDR family oxidoreductase [Paenibacillaceae bacterium]|nr:SDR family oxidoreductase [Paenibacillaceae bacterium]